MESSRYASHPPEPPPPCEPIPSVPIQDIVCEFPLDHIEETIDIDCRSKMKRPPYLGAYILRQTTDPDTDPMDEFAQTRPPDDLFDDDFMPIAQPIVEQDPTYPAPTTQAPSAPVNAPRAPRAYNPRGRGSTQPPPRTTDPPTSANGAEPSTQPPRPDRPQGTSVRGDRTLTGGPARSKLSEQELEEKMRSMALKNAELQAAHEKSAADAEAFAAREAAAAQRRREDKVNRQQMMGERERNRMRKLQSQGGREWDSEKREEDFRQERGARRGAFGGIAGSRFAVGEREGFAQGVSMAEAQDPVSQWVESQAREVFGDRGRGRGRGGRGRGRGRGGRENGDGVLRPKAQMPLAPPMPSDFPDLPAASVAKANDVKPAAMLQFPTKKATKPEDGREEKDGDAKDGEKMDDRPKPTKQFSFGFNPKSPAEKKSWADQMDGVTTPT